MRPFFEHVMMDSDASFVWRCDDYPWRRSAWNVHPEYEIHLIRNAAGISFIGDFIGEFEPGNLFLVGGGLPHNWVTDTRPGEIIRGRDIVLQFDAERLRQAAASLPELREIEILLERSARGLAFQGETQRAGGRLLEEMGTSDGLERLSLFLQLLGMLARSSNYAELSSAQFAPEIDHVALDLVRQAIAYIVQNFTRDVTLPEVAAQLGMTESTFSRFFKKNSGNSFTDYVIKLRVSRACELLSNSDLPIMDICFEVGYANLSNFNRTFLRHRGHTPSAYRRLALRLSQPARHYSEYPA